MVIKSIMGHKIQDNYLSYVEDLSQKQTKIKQSNNNTKMRLLQSI